MAVRKSLTFEFGNIDGLRGANNILDAINECLEEMLNLTKGDLHEEVNTAVPLDTGLMRETVHNNIEQSNNQRPYKLTIFFGAPQLEYTKYVDKMPTYGKPHVRHPPYTAPNTQHLLDPEAEGEVFSKHLASFTKFRCQFNWERAKLKRTGVFP